MPVASSSDLPPSSRSARRGARATHIDTKHVPRIDEDPSSQDPTAIAERYDEPQREADEHVRVQSSWIPIRTGARIATAPFRLVFLLSHLDGRSTIAEIAATSQLPIGEVTRSFVRLAADGIVELRRV